MVQMLFSPNSTTSDGGKIPEDIIIGHRKAIISAAEMKNINWA